MTRKELQDLESQWKEMNHYLLLNCASKNKHNQVFDRLVWLKKRIDNCKETTDYSQVLCYFNETVFFFNQALGLDGKSKFNER